jgi:SAM-dependent methyltransferase
MFDLFRKSNAGWRGNEPTKFVIDCFEKGYFKPGIKVLDIGSGFGRNSNWLALKGAIVTAININRSEIRDAKINAKKLGVNVNYLRVDATRLPFEDKTFDIALDLGCSHMLSEEGQVKAETEVARILKSGGHLIYFGFSKSHPAYKTKPESPQFRNLEDVIKIYGNHFQILSTEETSWKPDPAEKSNFTKHVGLNIVMQRKIN